MAISQIVELGPERKGNWLLAELEQRWPAPNKRVDPGWFHPSALSHPCDAFLAFQFLGIQPRMDLPKPQTRRIFDNGHARDRDWKGYLEDTGLSVASWQHSAKHALLSDGAPCICPCGTPCPPPRHICIPEHRIRGELDDLVVVPGKPLSVFEFKTKNSNLWDTMTGPDSDHIVQVQPYMYATGAKQTQIVYENKNNQQLKEFTIDFRPLLWDSIVLRVHKIMDQLATGQTPLRTPSKYETECDFFIPTEEFPGCSMANFTVEVDDYRKRQGLE